MSEDVKVAKDSIEDSTVEGVRSLEADKYKYGFDSDIEQEFAKILSVSFRPRRTSLNGCLNGGSKPIAVG